MVLRIALDVVRRRWKAIAFAVFQLYLIRKIPWEFWPQSDPMAWLLSGAAILTTAPGAMLESRELYQLPVSRRTWWLTRWWLSTAGAVLVAQLALALAEWSVRSRWPSGAWLVLSTTVGFLYAGCVMALAGTRVGQRADKPLFTEPAPNPAVPRPPVRPAVVWWLILKVGLRVLAGTFVVLTAPVVIPFFVSRYLPHAFSEMNALSAILLFAMAACAAWGYRHQPSIEARPNQRAARPMAGRGDRREAPTALAETTAVPARTRFEDRLTGLQLPLWRAGRKYVITYSIVISAGIGWWWVASFFRTVPALSDVLGRLDLLPLASPHPHVTEPITVGLLFVIAGLLDVALLTNTRLLRMLPLSATQLSCLPPALGLLSAAMLWIVFLALHLLVLRTMPVSLRVDLFIAFAAFSSLAHVLRTVLPGQLSTRTSLGVMGPLGIVWLAVGYAVDSADTFRADLVQPAMFVGGLAILAGSFWLMRLAVMRRSQMYRPQPTGARGL